MLGYFEEPLKYFKKRIELNKIVLELLGFK